MQCIKTIVRNFFAPKSLLFMQFISAALLIFGLQAAAAGSSPDKIGSGLKNKEIGNDEPGKQGFTISGKVTNERNEPLQDVSVSVKNENAGTKTDVEGKYSIIVNDKRSVLVFSYVGYTIQEQVTGNRKTMD